MDNPQRAQLESSAAAGDFKGGAEAQKIRIALLTGGGDKPYVYGLATALASKGISVDLIGSDEVDCPEFHSTAHIAFLNLRGSTDQQSGFLAKVSRILLYYARLIRYTVTAKPKVYHILWNNRFEALDRTLLMGYYKLLGKRIVLTVHNVNTAKRDSKDSFFNRLTLRIQYRLADILFVHTSKMQDELAKAFKIKASQVRVIPLGINNAVPDTALSRSEAKNRLGFRDEHRIILFFGRIAPYKGVECLVEAFTRLRDQHPDYRLVIAGSLKNCAAYWKPIEARLQEDVQSGRALVRVEFIPDEETEVYFKAADVFVLPYRDVYDSGVLYLGYSFGLPVLLADVGSLKQEVQEGVTGYVFRAEDSDALARAIERYYGSELFANLESRRADIKRLAGERHSWEDVGQTTREVYSELLGGQSLTTARRSQADDSRMDLKAGR